MPKPSRCPKCDSTKIILDAHMTDEPGHRIELVAQAKPEAKIFKKGTKARIQAMVCGACGYLELSVPDYLNLLDEHRSKAD